MFRSFKDLARTGVRLAMGDPQAMAFGRTAVIILEKSGLKREIEENIVVYGATVKQLALYVAQGDVDAAIIGRADAFQHRNRISTVPIPTAYFYAETIAIAVLDDSKNLKPAQQFRDFIVSKEAIAVFKQFGFLPIQAWKPMVDYLAEEDTH